MGPQAHRLESALRAELGCFFIRSDPATHQFHVKCKISVFPTRPIYWVIVPKAPHSCLPVSQTEPTAATINYKAGRSQAFPRAANIVEIGKVRQSIRTVATTNGAKTIAITGNTDLESITVDGADDLNNLNISTNAKLASICFPDLDFLALIF